MWSFFLWSFWRLQNFVCHCCAFHVFLLDWLKYCVYIDGTMCKRVTKTEWMQKNEKNMMVNGKTFNRLDSCKNVLLLLHKGDKQVNQLSEGNSTLSVIFDGVFRNPRQSRNRNWVFVFSSTGSARNEKVQHLEEYFLGINMFTSLCGWECEKSFDYVFNFEICTEKFGEQMVSPKENAFCLSIFNDLEASDSIRWLPWNLAVS